VHFCSHLCALEKIFRSVTNPKIVPDQMCLTPELFVVGLLKKKIYLDDMSILSILLNLEPGCYIVDVVDAATVGKGGIWTQNRGSSGRRRQPSGMALRSVSLTAENLVAKPAASHEIRFSQSCFPGKHASYRSTFEKCCSKYGR
jgi:hypothetical protein